MLSMPVNHPDVEDFITIKSDLNKVTNANISVRVTDDFMRAVENDDDFECSFERPETGEKITKTIRAKELFHKLAEQNWDYAEPGMLYWDTISNHNLLQYDENFEYAGTNPCAEEPLPSGGSCLLGSINLAEFVLNPFTPDAEFDIESFEHTVRVAVIALNEVLDEGLPLHPLQEQRDSVALWRQIGLGIMGLADMLIKLGITYGSDEAVKFSSWISHSLFDIALSESERLGRLQGSYPMFNKDAVNASEMMFGNHVEHLRNSQLLTIAPTGSLSTMLKISGGVEPIFANSYTRKTQSLHGEDVFYKVYTPIVQEYMDNFGISTEDGLPEFFVTSADISPENRIKMQSAWQLWIDASISSTINLPNSATIEDVENIYMSAWKHGLKGVTVYRAGCAREGVLTTDDVKKELVEQIDADDFDSRVPVSRKTLGVTSGNTYCKKCACGTLYITVNRDEKGHVVETFVHTSKGGICQANLNGLNRMISVGLRSGVKVEEIADQLKGITCPACIKVMGKGANLSGISCSDILGRTLLEFYNDKLQYTNAKNDCVELSGEKCPDCGSVLIHEGGCKQCLECGWSKCS